MLQESIYWDHGETPGRCFSIMFLRTGQGTKAAQVGDLLGRLWAMYQRLKQGRIDDLPGVDVCGGGLTVLLGYGPNTFKLADVRRRLPQELAAKHQFRRPSTGGGPILPGAGISYAASVARNPATEEIVVQAIAQTPLAAHRAIVETMKLLADHPNPVTGEPILELTAAFTGFNREDHRSWIDFHDGTSNLTAGQERLTVLQIKSQTDPEDAWTEGGTYLAFMRLEVDLASWRKLPLGEQELLVGRAKSTGCPLVGVGADGVPTSAPGCPFSGTRSVSERVNEPFFEPPVPTHPRVAQSHVQRANHHNGIPLERPESGRFFRQGYEFLDPPSPGRPLSLGLNFVSFQDTPRRLFFVLTTPGWLGSVNFGGDEANPPAGMASLLTAHAAGVFLVPPVVPGEPFPGASVFSSGSS